MLKLGDNNITKLYYGDKAISKAYWGDKLVFQASKPIFLDYISFDGKSYIDTEYCPNENTYIEYTCEIVTAPPSAWNGLFGSRQDTAYYAYNIFCRNSLNLRLDYGRYDEASYQTHLNTKYTIKAGLGEIYINDELVKSYTPQLQGTSPYPMYLGNFNNKGTPYTTGTPQRIYPCPIYENGVLVRDFKPCIAPNGQVAMYDEVNKKYHYGQGTGELKAGGRFVQSILFDGASFIDTGINIQTCSIECDIRFIESGTRQLMGFGASTAQYWGKGANQSTFEYISGTNALDRTLVTLEYNVDETSKTLTIYADGKSRTSTGTYTTGGTYSIGAIATTSTKYYCTIEVWRNTTIIDGKIVQDLRPYVDENGVACFKDVVTGNLFYNQGTGTLGYTE